MTLFPPHHDDLDDGLKNAFDCWGKFLFLEAGEKLAEGDWYSPCVGEKGNQPGHCGKKYYYLVSATSNPTSKHGISQDFLTGLPRRPVTNRQWLEFVYQLTEADLAKLPIDLVKYLQAYLKQQGALTASAPSEDFSTNLNLI